MKKLFYIVFITNIFFNNCLASDIEDIKEVLNKQNVAWNQGNIEAFMDGYWNNQKLRFASGKNTTHGWQQTLDGYKKRYPDKTAMGKLSFNIVEVNVYDNSLIANVFGKWKLSYIDSDKTPNGLFTLVFKKFNNEWKIISDHTSSE